MNIVRTEQSETILGAVQPHAKLENWSLHQKDTISFCTGFHFSRPRQWTSKASREAVQLIPRIKKRTVKVETEMLQTTSSIWP